MTYETRVNAEIANGLTRSDAQGVVEAEDRQTMKPPHIVEQFTRHAFTACLEVNAEKGLRPNKEEK